MARKKKPEDPLQEARDLNEVDERIDKQIEKINKTSDKLHEEQEKLNDLYTERSAKNAAFLRAVRDRAE